MLDLFKEKKYQIRAYLVKDKHRRIVNKTVIARTLPQARRLAKTYLLEKHKEKIENGYVLKLEKTPVYTEVLSHES